MRGPSRRCAQAHRHELSPRQARAHQQLTGSSSGSSKVASSKSKQQGQGNGVQHTPEPLSACGARLRLTSRRDHSCFRRLHSHRVLELRYKRFSSCVTKAGIESVKLTPEKRTYFHFLFVKKGIIAAELIKEAADLLDNPAYATPKAGQVRA